MIKLLYEGELVRENGVIKKASSSVTLIQTKNHNIIVDTSTRDKRELIIEELKKLNLEPKDIDVIINTHRHYDHIENNDLFKNAVIYASPYECEGCSLGYEFVSIDEFKDDEIEIIDTPGHTWGSISIIYKDYVIVGDAAPLKRNILENIPPGVRVSEKVALRSLQKIRSLKKHVITGHDGIVYADEL
ncbi:MBL fold metallo-hydrolase [Methanotorris igneus]|uniref:Beta-lactamase domain protein n=1 Tax=Methanotorris igneus (strain DSM 5666 / JCM 11834 / Kol 5) TaxID=880724 RepID=F6BAP4_METIK|nr:MBL fold metallo-hydrolase [Methanotorris igneus]AEF95858.1 beta-lactamase domain protein [Methanotorris igneus Kol 5]